MSFNLKCLSATAFLSISVHALDNVNQQGELDTQPPPRFGQMTNQSYQEIGERLDIFTRWAHCKTDALRLELPYIAQNIDHEKAYDAAIAVWVWGNQADKEATFPILIAIAENPRHPKAYNAAHALHDISTDIVSQAVTAREVSSSTLTIIASTVDHPRCADAWRILNVYKQYPYVMPTMESERLEDIVKGTIVPRMGYSGS